MGIDSIFGIGGPELFVILVIAGIVLGPKRIAGVARWLGKTTAYLQNVSRGFANQLRQELDGLDDGGDLKDMLNEVTNLRNEVNSLQKQLSGQVTDAVSETQEAVNSIQPPKTIEQPKPPVTPTIGNGANGTSATDTAAGETAPQLPKLVDVEDDLE